MKKEPEEELDPIGHIDPLKNLEIHKTIIDGETTYSAIGISKAKKKQNISKRKELF